MTPFLIIALAAISIHRLWFYEEIFGPLRQKIPRKTWTKPLTCPMCFAFWAGVIAYLLPEQLQIITALYAPTRLVLWAYSAPFFQRRFDHPTQVPPLEVPGLRPDQISRAGEGVTGGSRPPATTLIITTFANFDRAYSLVGVVLDHYRALLKHDPTTALLVGVHCDLSLFPKDLPPPVRSVPAVQWIEDQAPDHDVALIKAFLQANIRPGVRVFAHDLLFLSWFMSFAKALHEWPLSADVRWWNVAHSSPGQRVDSFRTRLPPGHRLLALAPALVAPFARYYDCPADRVDVMPNIRDLPTLRNFSTRTIDLIRTHSLLDADVVQVYPLSAPRAHSKGVRSLLRVFNALNTNESSALLVLVLAHDDAASKALVEGWIKEFDMDGRVVCVWGGLPGESVQELQQIANIFVCPTLAEASPLALMEAAMAGCLVVANDAVPSLKDVLQPDECLYEDFGTTGDISEQQAQSVADKLLENLNTPRERTRRAIFRRHSAEALELGLGALLRT
jgi:glycosyltransferase involved in cell wall biosynthesis